MTKYVDEDGDGVFEPDIDEEDDSDLEEIEPEELPLDQIDDYIEGSDGYDDEAVIEDDGDDTFGGDTDLIGEEDPVG